MSNDFDCEMCGQKIPERATAEYVAGLLAPPALMAAIVIGLYRLGYLTDPVYYATVGALGIGSLMLVRTDPHIRRWWHTSKYASKDE